MFLALVALLPGLTSSTADVATVELPSKNFKQAVLMGSVPNASVEEMPKDKPGLR